jgi:hypothetical protein
MPQPDGQPARRASGGRPALAPLRFMDADQVEWRVSERDCRRDPGARASFCLIFASEECWYRVWHYPPDWRGLTPAALVALS